MIMQNNLIIKANSTVKYKIYPPQKDYFEIIVISEPFAKFNIRLCESYTSNGKNHNQYYNLVDRPNEGAFCAEYSTTYKGLRQYETVITNNSNQDISIVIFTR